jgi:hypothetical protein
VLLALVAVATALSAPATAASPCWQQLLRDWRDRDIGSYPVHCYRQALERMPEDLKIYSTAPGDIARALATHLTRRTAGAPEQPVASSGTAAAQASGWRWVLWAGLGLFVVALLPAGVAIWRARAGRT